MLRTEFDEKEMADEFKSIGYIEGKTDGYDEGLIYSVRNLNKKGFSLKEISDLLELPEEDVNKYISSDNKQ